MLSAASLLGLTLALFSSFPELHLYNMQARHGGLLALKYLLAARPDAAAELLPDALPSAMAGLQVCNLWVGSSTYSWVASIIACAQSNILQRRASTVITRVLF